jgi:GxxExxY protein
VGINRITADVIGAAMAVHRELGPGLLESIYEACMSHELKQRGLSIERQVEVPIIYKGIQVKDFGFRIDMIVNKAVVVEFKSVEKLDPVHMAQVLTYLKLTKCTVGLIINFKVPLLKDGVKRVVMNFDES